MRTTIDWSQLLPFGAEVNVDLAQPLTHDEVSKLRLLFDAHHLLVFRRQELDEPRQNEVSAWFGTVERPNKASYLSADLSGLGMSELAFHSDLSCCSEPLEGISLYAIDVDAGAPPTMFIDAVAAAACLPEALHARLVGRHIMNLWPMSLNVRQRREPSPEDWPGTLHPLLKRHPRTGETILYLNASHSDRIVELAEGESEQLVQLLFQHLYDEMPRYRHQWENGDFVVWDNLALQHARDPAP